MRPKTWILLTIVIILFAAMLISQEEYVDDYEAKGVVTKDFLRALRSNIAIFYANQAVETGVARWPTLEELKTTGVVMDKMILENPYQTTYARAIVDATGYERGTVIGDSGGWAYNPETGEIWPNTDVGIENMW